jgi:hypothetical protein
MYKLNGFSVSAEWSTPRRESRRSNKSRSVNALHESNALRLEGIILARKRILVGDHTNGLLIEKRRSSNREKHREKLE